MSREAFAGLDAFPASSNVGGGWGREARRHGLNLRPARRDDLVFLRMLFEDGRAREMAMVDWPAALKQSFLDRQFALQHQSFISAFPAGSFLIAETGGQPVGRLYVEVGLPRALLIEIGVVAVARRRGYGRALVKEAKRVSRARACRELALHVDVANAAARQLYLSEGFCDEGEAAGRSLMVWRTGR